MTDLRRLSEAQMRRIEPCFLLSYGISRVDDHRVMSGVVFVIRNGLRWRDALRPTRNAVQPLQPVAPHGRNSPSFRRCEHRWKGCGGVFDRIFAGLAAEGGPPYQLMVDATHLKAHRTAASLLKEGLFPDVWGARRAA